MLTFPILRHEDYPYNGLTFESPKSKAVRPACFLKKPGAFVIDIRGLDRNDSDQVADLITQWAVVAEFDHPGVMPVCLAQSAILIRQDSPNVDRRYLLAWHGARITGSAVVELHRLDNRHLAQIAVRVQPQHRRRGIGRALTEAALDMARQANRTLAVGSAFAPVDGGLQWTDTGPAFAEKLGFSRALRYVIPRLDLHAVDKAACRVMLDSIRRKTRDYEILHWTGATPDDLVSDVAGLKSQVIAEVPTGDLDLETAEIDTARLRVQEALSAQRGERRLTAAVLHIPTGRIVGYTRLSTNPTTPKHAGVTMTLVEPGHRGRGLGTALKIEIQLRAARQFPLLRHIETSNADDNAHMIAVNDKLGFTPVGLSDAYQRHMAVETAAGSQTSSRQEGRLNGRPAGRDD